MAEVKPLSRSFDKRSGFLFIGAIHTAHSPNLDALSWFIGDVLPLIEAELGPETRLTVAGYIAPHLFPERFRDHSRVTLRGPVASTENLYESHRVFVAPTRFAAGLPYKVYEAASFGIPVVGTELLRAQMGWTDGVEIMAAEPSSPVDMAKACLDLYQNRERWLAVRDAAIRRLARDNGREQYANSLTAVLQSSDRRSRLPKTGR
jgi:glycosyltransferase involved in cell wall biosynthesis